MVRRPVAWLLPLVVAALCCPVPSSSFAPTPNPPGRARSRTVPAAVRSGKGGGGADENALPGAKDGDGQRRKALLGVLFPIAVALGANAPFIYVIAKPPTAEEREVMLMDFCKGDVCTLLGGGSGFVGGGGGGDYVGGAMASSMPSSEEYEAMAAAAAEKASSE